MSLESISPLPLAENVMTCIYMPTIEFLDSWSNYGYAVYMLISNDKKRTYIGCTNNLKRRLRQHNGEIKGGARATQTSRPWTFFCVTYCSTKCLDRSQACRFETNWKRATYSDSKKRSVYPSLCFDSTIFKTMDISTYSKRLKNRLVGFQKTCCYLSYTPHLFT